MNPLGHTKAVALLTMRMTGRLKQWICEVSVGIVSASGGGEFEGG